MKASRDIADLLAIMARLRTPVSGCPWDLEQTFATIAPYTIEEAYEVADAIERGDMEDLRDELGDLLLQVVFHARMAEEAEAFNFADVVESITAKMVRRHPHIFDDRSALDPVGVKAQWDAIKAAEKSARAARRVGGDPAAGPESVLSDVRAGMPALARAVRLQQRASTVGFDWNDARAVLAKIREELDEVEQELAAETLDTSGAEDELGDVLFAVANLARHLDVDPDAALRRSNAKFIRRFSVIESELRRRGSSAAEATLDEMEDIWRLAKTGETPS